MRNWGNILIYVFFLMIIISFFENYWFGYDRLPDISPNLLYHQWIIVINSKLIFSSPWNTFFIISIIISCISCYFAFLLIIVDWNITIWLYKKLNNFSQNGLFLLEFVQGLNDRREVRKHHSFHISRFFTLIHDVTFVLESESSELFLLFLFLLRSAAQFRIKVFRLYSIYSCSCYFLLLLQWWE